MKLRVIILSLVALVLVACNKSPEDHVFVGTIDGMGVTSKLTVEGNEIKKEQLIYELSYEEAKIENDEEAEQAAKIQRSAYNKLIEDVPEGAIEVNVTADKEKEAIVMSFDLDYSTSENIEALSEKGFLEDNGESEFVSFKKTKEQYEADGLKEQ